VRRLVEMALPAASFSMTVAAGASRQTGSAELQHTQTKAILGPWLQGNKQAVQTVTKVHLSSHAHTAQWVSYCVAWMQGSVASRSG
jgi:hypothetical protein